MLSTIAIAFSICGCTKKGTSEETSKQKIEWVSEITDTPIRSTNEIPQAFLSVNQLPSNYFKNITGDVYNFYFDAKNTKSIIVFGDIHKNHAIQKAMMENILVTKNYLPRSYMGLEGTAYIAGETDKANYDMDWLYDTEVFNKALDVFIKNFHAMTRSEKIRALFEFDRTIPVSDISTILHTTDDKYGGIEDGKAFAKAMELISKNTYSDTEFKTIVVTARSQAMFANLQKELKDQNTVVALIGLAHANELLRLAKDAHINIVTIGMKNEELTASKNEQDYGQ